MHCLQVHTIQSGQITDEKWRRISTKKKTYINKTRVGERRVIHFMWKQNHCDYFVSLSSEGRVAQKASDCISTCVFIIHTLLVTSEGIPLEILDLKDLTDSVSLPAPPPIVAASSSELWLDSLCLPPARLILPAAAAQATRIKQAMVSAKSSRPIVWGQKHCVLTLLIPVKADNLLARWQNLVVWQFNWNLMSSKVRFQGRWIIFYPTYEGYLTSLGYPTFM